MYQNSKNNAPNIASDVEYFLEQSKPKENTEVDKTLEQMNKVELQKKCVELEKDFTEEMTKAQLIKTINFQPEEGEDGGN